MSTPFGLRFGQHGEVFESFDWRCPDGLEMIFPHVGGGRDRQHALDGGDDQLPISLRYERYRQYLSSDSHVSS